MKKGDVVKLADGDFIFVNNIMARLHNRRITCIKFLNPDTNKHYYLFKFKRYIGSRNLLCHEVLLTEEVVDAMFSAVSALNDEGVMKLFEEFSGLNSNAITKHLNAAD